MLSIHEPNSASFRMALQLEESVGNPARPDRAPRLYMGKAGYFYRGIVEIECLLNPVSKTRKVFQSAKPFGICILEFRGYDGENGLGYLGSLREPEMNWRKK